MEPGQQFCLRWNNYQSTLQHVFHKQWVAGHFVDVSLIVEGRRLDCHKMVLSACSSYFETLLQEHSTHNHPFVILHDLPYHAVESIVNFMYQGQVNVSQEQLADLLKVAETLKVKGLADSAAINSFSKGRVPQNIPIPMLERAGQFPANVNLNGNVNYPNASAVYPQRVPSAKPTMNKSKPSVSVGRQPFKNLIEVASGSSMAKGPQKKRPRQDETNYSNLPTTLPNSLPPTPPASHNDTSLNESQPSPMAQSIQEVFTPKQEAEDETDGELQIDESAAPSPAEPDSRPCSRGPENEMRDQDEENRPHPRVLGPTSESNLLNPLNYTVSSFAAQEQGLMGDMKNIFGDMKNIKIEKPNYSLAAKNTNILAMPKNMVKTYTNKDLEEGIEAVLSGKLTPAKAISKFRIPRRTFFRRLSAVRKERGIPSAKENTADYYLSSDASGNVNVGALVDAQNRLGHPTPDAGSIRPENFQTLKVKSEKQLIVEPKKKKAKKDEAMTPNDSYFSLLNFATSNNYDTYLNYLKFVAQQPDARSAAEGAIDALKKAQGKDGSAVLDSNRNGIMVDGNRNLAPVRTNGNSASDSRSASPSSERSMSPVDNGKDLPADNNSDSEAHENGNSSSDDEKRIPSAMVTPDVTEAALALLSQKRDATLALVSQNGGSKSPLLKGRGRVTESSVSVS